MQSILITEPISTGAFYPQDVIEKGYQPLAIFSPPVNETSWYYQFCQSAAKKLPPETLIVPNTGSYSEVVARLRQYDIKAVIPGSEQGVVLADALTKEFALPGNDPQYSLLHLDKYKMQQALAQAGLRHIRSRLISSVAEALDFWKELQAPQVVLKPVAGAGTFGVHFCQTEDDIRLHADSLLNNPDFFEKSNDTFIMQEFIEGIEYVVNTASCAGMHRMTDMWVYSKVAIGNKGNAYNTAKLLRDLDVEHRSIVRYAYQTLDALHISYGSTHGEYMMTKTGPVLIELGARPMGGDFPKELLHAALGHHLTDASLDCYIHPERFEEACRQKYSPKLSILNKFFISPAEISVQSFPILSLLPQLKSYYYADLRDTFLSEILPQTVDLETASGHILLAHQDESVVLQDYSILRQLETTQFDLLFDDTTLENKQSSADEESDLNEIAALVPAGEGLYAGAQPWPGFTGTHTDGSAAFSGAFDYAVFDLLPNLVPEELIHHLATVRSHLKSGGELFVVNLVYQQFPGGRAGLELILQALGLCIDVPAYRAMSVLSAWKK